MEKVFRFKKGEPVGDFMDVMCVCPVSPCERIKHPLGGNIITQCKADKDFTITVEIIKKKKREESR